MGRARRRREGARRKVVTLRKGGVTIIIIIMLVVRLLYVWSHCLSGRPTFFTHNFYYTMYALYSIHILNNEWAGLCVHMSADVGPKISSN